MFYAFFSCERFFVIFYLYSVPDKLYKRHYEKLQEILSLSETQLHKVISKPCTRCFSLMRLIKLVIREIFAVRLLNYIDPLSSDYNFTSWRLLQINLPITSMLLLYSVFLFVSRFCFLTLLVLLLSHFVLCLA